MVRQRLHLQRQIPPLLAQGPSMGLADRPGLGTMESPQISPFHCGVPQAQVEPPGLADGAHPPRQSLPLALSALTPTPTDSSPRDGPSCVPPHVCPEIPACPPYQAESRGWAPCPSVGSLSPLIKLMAAWVPLSTTCYPRTPGSGSCPLASSCWQATSLSALRFSVIPFCSVSSLSRLPTPHPPTLAQSSLTLDPRAFLQSWGLPGWAQSSSCPPG